MLVEQLVWAIILGSSVERLIQQTHSMIKVKSLTSS
jgi:hypothetical protein